MKEKYYKERVNKILQYIQKRPNCRVQHVPVPQGCQGKRKSWARPPRIPEKDG